MSDGGPFSDVSANVLTSTEGAHIKNMSTSEADEHLRELTPLPSAEVEGAGGQSKVKCTRYGGLDGDGGGGGSGSTAVVRQW